MNRKNIFVIESDVNYLWSGFEKKLESLSALRSSSRVCAEAFDVSGLYTTKAFPDEGGVWVLLTHNKSVKSWVALAT